MICATDGCETTLGPRNKSGLCRSCVAKRVNADPAMNEKRRAGIKRRLDADPALREAMRKRGAAVFSRPEVRERARLGVIRCQNWKKGHAAITPEALARRSISISNTRLAHIPTDYRDLYRFLRKSKRLSVADATQACLDQQEADRRSLHKEWGVAA